MRNKPIIVLLTLTALLIIALIYVSVQSWGGPVALPRISFLGGPNKVIRSVDKDLPIQSGQTITIDNPLGTVTILGGQPSGSLSAEIKASGWTTKQATESADEIDVRVVPSSDGWQISVHLPQIIAERSHSIHITIELPPDVHVTANASLGKVLVKEHTGKLDIEASMGSVHIDQFIGDLIVNCRMGEIKVTAATIDQLLQLNSNMGSISFSGQLGANNRITSNMGSITMTLPDSTSVDVTADVNMGSIANALPFQGNSSDNRYTGQLGTGQSTGKLHVSSSMGSINIKGGYR